MQYFIHISTCSYSRSEPKPAPPPQKKWGWGWGWGVLVSYHSLTNNSNILTCTKM